MKTNIVERSKISNVEYNLDVMGFFKLLIYSDWCGEPFSSEARKLENHIYAKAYYKNVDFQ